MNIFILLFFFCKQTLLSLSVSSDWFVQCVYGVVVVRSAAVGRFARGARSSARKEGTQRWYAQQQQR
ncbi:hypothetical protein OAV88_01740 [bacterium]|nr:hypothetical protein [bacterium]